MQNIFGEQASKLASHFLAICIRAIDYCPPVDLELGEYLRALITADYDLVPDDRWAYREALIDAFRHRRIYPPNVTSLSEESLRWQCSELSVKRFPSSISRISNSKETPQAQPTPESCADKRSHSAPCSVVHTISNSLV